MVRSLMVLSAAAAALALAPAAADSAAAPSAGKSRVEVVFCLDTTGSMGGLIEGAKAKIWEICNQIAGGKPTPDLKVGLVAYRDRGDEYVTQVTDLSADLDAIHAQLKAFRASGGRDFPESVNQALADAVHKVNWSQDKKTLKIIFLVGDAPPHMDYADDVKYPQTCQKAVAAGIIINTIQCGQNGECTKAWKDIAAKSEGNFVAIAQDGGVKVVSTPFDKQLAELNRELTKTVLVYGDPKRQMADQQKNEAALRLSAEPAASRIAYQAKNAQVATYCLIDSIKQGRVKLEQLKKEELPPQLQKLNLAEQKEYLAKVEKQRAELNRQVLELDRKRTAYIAEEQAKLAKQGKAGFDGQVLNILRDQAKKFDIRY